MAAHKRFWLTLALFAMLLPGLPAAESPDAADGADVLRKVRKLLQGTLSETESEAAWKDLRDMGNLAVPGLLELYRQKKATPEMIPNLLLVLGDSKDPRAEPVLLEILNSDDAQTRAQAARAIAEANCKPARPALEKLAVNSNENIDVRLAAAQAGAKFGSGDCLKVLQELALSPRAEVRSRAIYGLGRHGGLEQAATIEKALEDADSSVREDAVEGLRMLGKKEVWGALVKAAGDKDYKVRAAAMDALRQLTRQKIENDPEAWRKWRAKQGEKPAASNASETPPQPPAAKKDEPDETEKENDPD